MDAQYFSFKDFDQLTITTRDLQIQYPHLLVLSNKDTLVLSVSKEHSDTFDSRIRTLVERMGGVPIPENIDRSSMD
ncbi:MAG: hypothetical protein IKQ33_04075 [Clostridia bacterium]|nr:hypothetical protein [Clostridia bacterium]